MRQEAVWIAALCALVADTSAARKLEPPPAEKTPITALTAPGLRHAEVVRVRRDFGNPEVDIALDAWTPERGTRGIQHVRMWWSDAVDRYPFEALALNYVSVHYRHFQADRWRVSVTGDGKRFVFSVRLHHDQPTAFTTITAADGAKIRDCMVDDAKLYARRFLGIPVGVRALVVVCRAPDGEMHRAPVVYETVRRGGAARQTQGPVG